MRKVARSLLIKVFGSVLRAHSMRSNDAALRQTEATIDATDAGSVRVF